MAEVYLLAHEFRSRPGKTITFHQAEIDPTLMLLPGIAKAIESRRYGRCRAERQVLDRQPLVPSSVVGQCFFVTTRTVSGNANKVTSYTDTLRPDGATYGVINKDAPAGELEVIPEKEEWHKRVEATGKGVVVYIHGYANTFPETVNTTSTILQKLQGRSSHLNVILYAWPSAGGQYGCLWYDGVSVISFVIFICICL